MKDSFDENNLVSLLERMEFADKPIIYVAGNDGSLELAVIDVLRNRESINPGNFVIGSNEEGLNLGKPKL